jgi:uncharacterized protein YkwD
MASTNPHASRPRSAVARGMAATVAVCALLALAPAGASAFARGHLPNCGVAVAAASAVPREAPAIRLARAAVCLINHRRTVRGLPRLRLNRRLSRAAMLHTHDMVRRHYFSHVSRSGRDVSDRLHATRYLGGRFSWVVGENLAWGSGTYGSPRHVVRSWMKSSGHRRNILDRRFRELGIGVKTGSPVRTDLPAATYTTTFGVRRR